MPQSGCRWCATFTRADIDLRRAGAAGQSRHREGGDRVGHRARARRGPRARPSRQPDGYREPTSADRSEGRWQAVIADGFLLIELNQLEALRANPNGYLYVVENICQGDPASSGCGSFMARNYSGFLRGCAITAPTKSPYRSPSTTQRRHRFERAPVAIPTTRAEVPIATAALLARWAGSPASYRRNV